MAMTPLEQIRFFDEQTVLWKEAFEAAFAKQIYWHCATCINQVFEDGLMAGLVRWRVTKESPTPAFEFALTSLSEGNRMLLPFAEERSSLEFSLTKSSIVSFLVNRPSIDHDLVELSR